MTVSSSVSLTSAEGNGVSDQFSFSPITVFDADDLEVTYRNTAGVDTVLSRGTGSTTYSVTLNSTTLPTTGYITYPASGGTKVAADEFIFIKRVMDLTQEVDLENQGGYFADTQEGALDKLTMIAIQHQEELDRAIKVPVGSEATDLELPEPSPGEFLVWNAEGDGLTNSTGTFSVDSTTLVVVSDSQPGVVEGRIWIDTNGPTWVVRLCDGTDYNFRLGSFSASDIVTQSLQQIFTNLVSMSSTTAVENLKIISTDAGAVGPKVVIQHDSASPAASDTSAIIFRFDDNAGNETDYAQFKAKILDTTNGSEDGSLTTVVMQAGAAVEEVVTGDGTTFGAATTGGMPGPGKVNAGGYEVNGNPITMTTPTAQTGTTHSPTVADNGKIFYYTNAAGCAVTLPLISGVFEGYEITILNLCGGAVYNDPANDTIRGLSVTVAVSGANVIYPNSGTTLTIHALAGTNKQTFKVINGQWHTMLKRWLLSSDRYDTGGCSGSGVNTMNAIHTDIKLKLYCVTADGNFTVGTYMDGPVTSHSSATVNTYGAFVVTTPTTYAWILGTGGILAWDQTGGAQVILATTKWVVHVYYGYGP